MADGRLSVLAIFHIHKHKDGVAFDDVVTEFARLGDRCLALCLLTPCFYHFFTQFFCCSLPKTLGLGKLKN